MKKIIFILLVGFAFCLFSGVAFAGIGDDEVVIIPDAGLEGLVKAHLGLAETNALTVEDMAELLFLNGEDAGIVSLEGLQYAKNLQWVNLQNNSIADISPLLQINDGVFNVIDLRGNPLWTRDEQNVLLGEVVMEQEYSWLDCPMSCPVYTMTKVYAECLERFVVPSGDEFVVAGKIL